MSTTKIKALTSFSDGVVSMYVGEIANVDATKASAFISGGLAVEFDEPIVPSGSIEITANDTYDVTTKETAIVNVPAPTGSVTVDANGTYDVTDKASVVVNVSVKTVTYDVNGGTGEVAAATAIAGNTINLDDGAGITPPTDKVFKGWATTDDAEAADVTSPYTVTDNITLYAVYGAAE